MKIGKKEIKQFPIPCWAYLPLMAVACESALYLATMEVFVFGRFAAIAIFALGFGGILALIASLFPKKAGKWVTLVLGLLLVAITMTEYFINDAYQVFMGVKTIMAGAGGVATTYMDVVKSLLVRNAWLILLVLVPVVGYGIFAKPVEVPWKLRGVVAGVTLAAYAGALGIVHLVGLDAAKLNTEFNFNNGVRSFGLSVAFTLDTVRGGGDATSEEPGDLVFDIPAAPPVTVPVETVPSEEGEEPVVYYPQVLEIDFAALAESERNGNVAALHAYVASQPPAMENEYTGLFAGKNLIIITGEAFTHMVIDPELTPTLYRMATEGIQFTEFYQPAWGAGTVGGEYANLVGLIPQNGGCMWEAVNQDLFLTMGNQLQEQGYYSAAFHNNSFTYYDRHETHTYLGYDLWMGYGNGMEEGVDFNSPASDLQMFEFTVPAYTSQQPFSLYYMSVSGHAGYSQGNAMAAKNYHLVEHLDCSERIKCYIACNLELEHAMAYLISELEKAGIADDTVIVIAPDHYPYGLDRSSTWGNDREYLSELFGVPCDSRFVRDRSGLIIWSGCIEDMDIVVDTPVTSLDILPTLSNLFDVEYDSRLLIGRDVFSDQQPLVFWDNYSWITELGTYNSATGTFTPREGVEVPEGYVEQITTIVRNKVMFSNGVAWYDYYNYVAAALPPKEETGS